MQQIENAKELKVSAHDPLSVRQARIAVVGWMDGQVCAEMLPSIGVVASELITNAVIHTNGEATVTARMLPTGIAVLEVADTSHVHPQIPAAATADGGRGLLICMQFATITSEATPTGKVVTATCVSRR